jgi:GTP-binding protein LepA
MRGGTEYVIEMGQFRPGMTPATELTAGQVGYFTAQIKNIQDVTSATRSPTPPTRRPGRCPATRSRSRWSTRACTRSTTTTSRTCARPGQAQAQRLQLHLPAGGVRGARLRLPLRVPGHAPPRDHPAAAGARLRVGPGQTAPNVTYEILKKKGGDHVNNPQDVPDAGQIEEFREPIVRISFLLPSKQHRRHHAMCGERRGDVHPHRVPEPERAILVYEMPLAEVIYDMYDKLKSVTHGYGTMDYEFRASGRRPGAAGCPGPPQARRCPVHDRPPQPGRAPGPQADQEAAQEIDRHLFEVRPAGGHRHPRRSPARRSRR